MVKLDLQDENTLGLLGLWIYMVGAFYFDVIMLVFFLYYIDVALDLNAIYIFMMQGKYKYMGLNCLAIFLANVWTASTRWTICFPAKTPFVSGEEGPMKNPPIM